MILAVHSAEDCSASNMNPEFRKKVVPFIVNRITLALFTLSTLFDKDHTRTLCLRLYILYIYKNYKPKTRCFGVNIKNTFLFLANILVAFHILLQSIFYIDICAVM